MPLLTSRGFGQHSRRSLADPYIRPVLSGPALAPPGINTGRAGGTTLAHTLSHRTTQEDFPCLPLPKIIPLEQSKSRMPATYCFHTFGIPSFSKSLKIPLL